MRMPSLDFPTGSAPVSCRVIDEPMARTRYNQRTSSDQPAAGAYRRAAGADVVCRRVTVRVAEGQVAPAVVAALRAISREAGAATDSLVASVAVGLARCELGLSLRPRRFRTVLWYNLSPSDLARDPFSLHGGCCLGKGGLRGRRRTCRSLRG